eukprot:Sspe_Gene.1782::Locus_592_Transcript_2_4_Confidence_0.500_Length_1524::g.1782::m.1782
MGGPQPCNPAGPKVANYIMNGHWSEKASREAELYCKVNHVGYDPTGLYFTVPEPETWNIDPKGTYLHYTSADTRQGFQFIDFPYHVIPKGMKLASDQSADLGRGRSTSPSTTACTLQRTRTSAQLGSALGSSRRTRSRTRRSSPTPRRCAGGRSSTTPRTRSGTCR